MKKMDAKARRAPKSATRSHDPFANLFGEKENMTTDNI